MDDGYRFENLVAFHLHKAVQTWTALGLGEFELRYVRDRNKREVDFLLVDRGRPVCPDCRGLGGLAFGPAQPDGRGRAREGDW